LATVIDNQSQRFYAAIVPPLLSLESLPHRQRATVAEIAWTSLSVPEARRLRELGFDEGVGVEVLHRATLGKGPIACRIGRMTVAIRRAVAGAIHVSPVAG
jgi:ferrous iron transport protein A